LKEQSKLCNQIDKLDETLALLLDQNLYIKEEADGGYVEELSTVVDARTMVAFDAGLFLSNDETTTTLNILRMGEDGENETLSGKIQKL
jgi:hypothetical protein